MAIHMVNCHDLKKDDKLVCPDCGLTLQVMSVCKEHCGDKACEDGKCEPCTFVCCGKDLVKK